MSAVVIGGKPVHYEVFGRGQPVLFLHGWFGSWRYWVPTMEAISDRYRTYALDFWGFGDSAKAETLYRLSDYVVLIDGFLQTLGIGQAVLVGHALGARVALEYALVQPNLVNKLMLVSLPLTPDSLSRKLIGLAQNSFLSQLIWRLQVFHPEVAREANKTDRTAIQLSLQSMARQDVSAQVGYLGQYRHTPLLVVYGEKDDVIDPAPARQLDSRWPNVRPIGLPDSKHFPMLDEPAKFSRLLKDFLELDEDLAALELKEEWRRRTR